MRYWQPLDCTRLEQLDHTVRPLLSASVPVSEARVVGLARSGESGEIAGFELKFGSRCYMTTPGATRKLLDLVRTPAEFLEDLEDQTALDVINTKIRRRLDPLIRAATDGDRVVWFRHGRLADVKLQPSEITNFIKEYVSQKLSGQVEAFVDCSVSEEFVQRYVFLGTTPHTIAGDAHRVGVEVEIDYSGFDCPEVKASLLRVVCGNVLLVGRPRERGEFVVKSNEDFQQKLLASVQESLDEVHERLKPLLEMARLMPAGNFEELWRQIEQRLNWPVSDVLDAAYGEENVEESFYRTIQALTRAANREDLPVGMSRLLRQMAGRLVFQPGHLSPGEDFADFCGLASLERYRERSTFRVPRSPVVLCPRPGWWEEPGRRPLQLIPPPPRLRQTDNAPGEQNQGSDD